MSLVIYRNRIGHHEMTSQNETTRKLAEISDTGLFEKLATAVLRAANPDRYAAISHTGISPTGKTIKSPLDGCSVIHDEGRARIVAAAHSTCRQQDIHGKWLHDPSTVRVRKPGGKPTAPEGDVRKAIREISRLRTHNEDLKATLALTCTVEPDLNSIADAMSLCENSNVELDIWPASRIADFLDSDPNGQWIRYLHLGEPVERASVDLMRLHYRQKKEALSATLAVECRIKRSPAEIEIPDDVLLVGPSGLGKTIYSLQLLDDYLDQGGDALILDHESLENAKSIEEAIDTDLRKREPRLEPHSGKRLLAMFSSSMPLIVLVEDINKAADPGEVLNKVFSWIAGRNKDPKNASHWRLLCPVWPRQLDLISPSIDPSKLVHYREVGRYTEDEAIDAVRARSMAQNLALLPTQFSQIANSLGRDPLLIGLHDFSSHPNPLKTIDEYIDKEFRRIATAIGLTLTDIKSAAAETIRDMLRKRNLSPSWKELTLWAATEQERLRTLRAIVSHGSVLRIIQRSGDEVLVPRHDRVLFSLITAVISEDIRNVNPAPEYLSDQYFSEHIGYSIATTKAETTTLHQVAQANPLALFYAFQVAVSAGENRSVICDEIIRWLSTEAAQSRRFDFVRYRASRILAEIDAEEVISISKHFSGQQDDEAILQANFRNGDIVAGLQMAQYHPLGSTIPGRESLYAHVFASRKSQLISHLKAILENNTTNPATTRASLYLAGYLGDQSLENPICSAWNRQSESERNLEAYIWAACRCFSSPEGSCLPDIFDVWATHPDSDEDAAPSVRTRVSIIEYGVAWAFRTYTPSASIPYLIAKAKNDDRLCTAITYMLRGVDDPHVLEHIAEYLSVRHEISRHFFASEWESHRRKDSRAMSEATREALFRIAQDQSKDENVRKAAFYLWQLTKRPSDISALQAIPADSPLHSRAIFARAQRKDVTMVDSFLAIRNESLTYWWQAGRYIWTPKMTEALRADVLKSAISDVAAEQDRYESHWILSELLMNLDSDTAESILLDSWTTTSRSPYYFQAAIYHGTPKLMDAARKCVSLSRDPQSLFTHVTSHMGLRTYGRKGIWREAQARSLLEFAQHLSDMDIYWLWDLCNERNWIGTRRQYLDPLKDRMAAMSRRAVIGVDISQLSDHLSDPHRGPLYWWYEEESRRGNSHQEIITALLDWLEQETSPAAFDAASIVLTNHGRRSDIARMREIADRISGIDDAAENVSTSIMSRTLV